MKLPGNIWMGHQFMEGIHIRVRGQIDTDWADYLAGLTIIHTTDGETILSGLVPDQSTLYGLLNKLSDLGLQLISVSSWRLKKEQIKEVRYIGNRTSE
jgi:hypothetical protein